MPPKVCPLADDFLSLHGWEDEVYLREGTCPPFRLLTIAFPAGGTAAPQPPDCGPPEGRPEAS